MHTNSKGGGAWIETTNWAMLCIYFFYLCFIYHFGEKLIKDAVTEASHSRRASRKKQKKKKLSLSMAKMSVNTTKAHFMFFTS